MILLSGTEDKNKLLNLLKKELKYKINQHEDAIFRNEKQQRAFNAIHIPLFETPETISTLGYADLWAICYTSFFKKPHPDFMVQMQEITDACKDSKAQHFYLPASQKNSIDNAIKLFYNNNGITPVILEGTSKKQLKTILDFVKE